MCRESRRGEFRTLVSPAHREHLAVGTKVLCVLDGCGSHSIAFANLFHSELASANAASPGGGRRVRDSGRRGLIVAPIGHELATALRTPSLDHKV